MSLKTISLWIVIKTTEVYLYISSLFLSPVFIFNSVLQISMKAFIIKTQCSYKNSVKNHLCFLSSIVCFEDIPLNENCL